MFKDLIKSLNAINGQKISIPIEPDGKGYIDKQCPAKDCEFIFKVNADDWSNKFKDERVWCPFCRHEAPADQWFTIDQIEHAKREALAILKGKMHNALISGAQKFNNRQPKNSFISISLKVTGGYKRTYIIPARAAELMQLEIQCENCDARFAVIGSAYFCPCCGFNSVTRTFRDSLRKISAKKDNLDVIRNAVIESSGKDEAELTCRSLLETCVSDGVVAFQKYCEGMYEPFGQAKFNAFQRLNEAKQLWSDAIHLTFDSWITDAEFIQLETLYQKRHLLAHSEGIVDSKYIEKTNDNSYKVGQRIRIISKDIDFLLYALDKLADGIKLACENCDN